MFLFFSKLIPPLLFYPLGITILLLLFSLFLLYRKRSNRLISLIVYSSLLILILSSNQFVSDAVIRSLEFQYIPTSIPNADGIVVLGGAIKPQRYPRPSYDFSEASDRVIYGVQLFKSGKAPKLIFSGGRIDWLEEGGRPESVDMAAIGELLGVPQSAILQDSTSLNTYENAINVKAILETENIDRILLVTSAIHMPRSVAIFRKLGIELIPAPTDFLTTIGDYNQGFVGLLLDLLPNASSLNNITKAIKEYVGFAVYWLKGWV